MYVSFYFPISDFRDLISSDAQRGPIWPVLPGAMAPFQPNLGEVRRRPRGGLNGWIQEGAICEIGKSIEIETAKYGRVRKRFYFDGSFSGYFSLGFAGLLPRNNRNCDAGSLLEIVLGAMSRSVRTRHLQESSTVADFGRFACKLYALGTTPTKKDNLELQHFERKIYSSKPFVTIEIASDRLSAEFKDSSRRSWRFLENGVHFIPEMALGATPAITIIEKKSRSENYFSREVRMVLSRLYCEFCLLQASVSLIASKESGSIKKSKCDYFFSRVSDSLSRLTGAKRVRLLRDPEFYRSFTDTFLDMFEMSKIDELARGLEVHAARNNFRHALVKSHLWSRIESTEEIEFVREKIMGNKYEIKAPVSGPVGDNAKVDNSTFNQSVGVTFSASEMVNLGKELEKLKQALIVEASTESLAAATAISEAEKSAADGDSYGLVGALRKAGAWAFDVATKIGVSVAAEAIKKAAGL